LLPKNGQLGGQWKDHRQILNGMLWRLRSGAPWEDVPSRYGCYKTIWDRFNRWSKDGTLDRIALALQDMLDDAGLIDWDLWCIDGSHIRAARVAGGARQSSKKNV
jgi:transposase